MPNTFKPETLTAYITNDKAEPVATIEITREKSGECVAKISTETNGIEPAVHEAKLRWFLERAVDSLQGSSKTHIIQ